MVLSVGWPLQDCLVRFQEILRMVLGVDVTSHLSNPLGILPSLYSTEIETGKNS